jgi:hypothetical protein
MKNQKTEFALFKPGADGASATGRCLPGQYDQANRQEWSERGTIDGRAVVVFYEFDNAEADVEHAEDMPFDAEHVSRIDNA